MIQFDPGYIVLGLVCLGLVAMHVYDSVKHQRNLESVLKAALAQNPLEYNQSLKTPREQAMEDRATAALADKAYQLEKIKDPENVARIKGERNFPVN